MIDKFTFNIENQFQKSHNFLFYDPYLTFSNDKNVFIDKNGQPRIRGVSDSNLYSIGKKAFQLLEIHSENDLQELCRGYFTFICIIADMALDMHSEGRLIFESKNNKSGAKIIAKFINKPTRHAVMHYAPDLLKLALSWGNELSLEEKKFEDFNFLDDVYLASLTHCLLELDETLMLIDLDSQDSLVSMESVVRCFSFAESINEYRDLRLRQRKKIAKFAANKRHKRTNLAKQKIREIWSTGKYRSRDICAEQECAELELSFSTARKALRNLPNHT